MAAAAFGGGLAVVGGAVDSHGDTFANNQALGGWTGKGGDGGKGGEGAAGGEGGEGGVGGSGGPLGGGGGGVDTTYDGPNTNGNAGDSGNGGDGGNGGAAGNGGNGGPSATAGFAEGGNLFVGNGTMAVDGATSYTGTGAVYGGVADLPGNGGEAGEPGDAGEAGAFNPEIPLGGQIDSENLWGTNGSLGQDGLPGASGASALAGQDGDGGFPGIALDPDLHGSVTSSPYTVVNSSDSGPGSLRAAIEFANDLAGSSNTIIFALPVGDQTIELASALPALYAPMIAQLDSSQNVTIVSPADGSQDNFAALDTTGGGTLTISGANDFTGNLQVDDGTLQIDNSATPTLGDGVGATVNGGATLELSGNISALSGGSNGTDITNDSSAAAGIFVSGTNQAVGNIDGTGNLVLDAGSDLTANSIVQNSLVIGAGATLTIAPSAGAIMDSTAASSAADSALGQAALARLAAIRAQRFAARSLAENSVTTRLDSTPIEATPTLVTNTVNAIDPAPTVASSVSTVPTTPSNAAIVPASSVSATTVQTAAIQTMKASAPIIAAANAPSDRASSPSIEASNRQTIADSPKNSSSSSMALTENGLDSIDSPRVGFGSGDVHPTMTREAIDSIFAGDDDFAPRDDSLLADDIWNCN